jgi:hypothetical protein
MDVNHLIVQLSGYGRYQITRIVHANWFPFEDPLAGIQNLFAAALMRKLNLNNLRTISRDESLTLGEQPLARGAVFKFVTRHWQITQRFVSYAPRPGTTLPTYYDLSYAADGILFRGGEHNLLWKARCDVSLSFKASVDILLQKLIADEDSLIHLKRREAEASCAEQLLEKFFFQ